ncbi:MAG TPA: hypothetical protein PLL75_06650 [Candidatus Omnitrophota bacterium]|nr:hypothetical protein [Candidatus Omnitrophota bacterium]HPS37387.1 hypothetical protein [Candidatus Omnitrophota bacterium]
MKKGSDPILEKRGLTLFLFALFFLCAVMVPGVLAEQSPVADGAGQEGDVSQAQAVLASLFGPEAKMPDVPRPQGTIALPSFDSGNLQIDESVAHKPKE